VLLFLQKIAFILGKIYEKTVAIRLPLNHLGVWMGEKSQAANNLMHIESKCGSWAPAKKEKGNSGNWYQNGERIGAEMERRERGKDGKR